MPLSLGIWDPYLMHHFLGSPDPPPQMVSRFSQPFFHNTHSLSTDGQNYDGTRRVNGIRLLTLCVISSLVRLALSTCISLSFVLF